MSDDGIYQIVRAIDELRSVVVAGFERLAEQLEDHEARLVALEVGEATNG